MNNTGLDCSDNELTSLDVSNNQSLIVINCRNNLLTKIDLAENGDLGFLSCQDNKLTSLDLSKSIRLDKLHCYGNDIANLNISYSSSLVDLYKRGLKRNTEYTYSGKRGTTEDVVEYLRTLDDAYPNLVISPTTKIVTDNSQSSEEKVENFVDRIYTVWLERSADSNGAAEWAAKLEDKSWSGAQVAEFFVFSKESMDKNRTNEDFIDALYKLLMNRDPAEDPSGYAYWKEQMQNGMSKYQLVASFIASPEYTQICTDYGIERGSVDMDTVNQVQGFVGRFYTLAMERDADQAGVDYWTAGLRRGEFNGASIAANFFFSDEMNAKHISDEKYIELLYQVMMDRPSDEGGKAYWLGNMADGMTKEQVLNGFITSPEFTGICADYGIERGSL